MALALAGSALVAGAAVEAQAARINNRVAVFSGIDKITGRITTFDVYIDETVQFGALQVTPRVCYSRDETEAQKIDAFVEMMIPIGLVELLVEHLARDRTAHAVADQVHRSLELARDLVGHLPAERCLGRRGVRFRGSVPGRQGRLPRRVRRLIWRKGAYPDFFRCIVPPGLSWRRNPPNNLPDRGS